MRKYKCNDCGKKELEKVVYTEERCQGCGFVNHNPHQLKRKEEVQKR